MSDKDFYIGWSEEMPDKNKKVIKKILIPLFIFLPLLAAGIVIFMNTSNMHRFELGQVKSFTGTIYYEPFPVLILDENAELKLKSKEALLVGYGKHGAEGFIKSAEKKLGPLSGKQVEILGTLIYGDDKVLIELTKKEASIVKIIKDKMGTPTHSPSKTLQLSGEIVDPKCWFGVMKPGDGKVHKSCAIRCISGGIPPVLRVISNNGFEYYILKGQNGEAINQDVLQFVAEPVMISGQTQNINGWNVLYINPSEIKII